MMRIVDGLLAIPSLFLLVYLFTVFQASVVLMVLVIGLVAWLVPARLVRAETLRLRTLHYVEAVWMMGGSRRRMIMRHIIPNAIGTIMVNATFQVADAILALASLQFPRPRHRAARGELGRDALDRHQLRVRRVLVADLPAGNRDRADRHGVQRGR